MYCKTVKVFLIIISVLLFLFLVGCDSVNDTDNGDLLSLSPSTQEVNAIQSTHALLNADISSLDDQLDSSGFLRSSLQDGYYVRLDGKIITKVMGRNIFSEKPVNGKYLTETGIEDLLELDGYLSIEKVFSYDKKVVYVGQRKTNNRNDKFREIIIQNFLTGNKESIEIGFHSSNSCYILGNRLYFDEFVTDQFNDKKYKYIVKYLNLDSLEQKTVFTYDKEFDYARFVLKEDGEIAFIVSDSMGISQIYKYSSGAVEEVVKKRWCNLIDYDKRGIFYTAPTYTNDELSNFTNSAQINEYEFNLKPEKEEEKVLLKVDKFGDFKIFDNFFLYVDLYSQDFIMKYNYEGVQLDKYDLINWPNFGKRVFTISNIIYGDGVMQNLFYRQDTNELEIQSINID